MSAATWLIVRKELEELRRSPILLLSMAALPATMVIVPVALVAYLADSAPPLGMDFVRELYDLPKDESLLGVLVLAVSKNWLPLFLVMPIFLPILIAAQSIGGEKERRTLEPLLASPVSTLDIVLGKSVAALVPALAITWFSAAVFCVGIDVIAAPRLGRVPLPDGPWLFGILVLSPLLALFGNACAVVVSALLSDPRAAQNVAAMTVVPLIGVMIAQLAGKVLLGPEFYVALAAGIAVADVILVALATKLFDREKLLTRWR